MSFYIMKWPIKEILLSVTVARILASGKMVLNYRISVAILQNEFQWKNNIIVNDVFL